MVFGAVVGAPFSEDFLFRGFLFRWLRAKRSLRFAAVVSAAISSRPPTSSRPCSSRGSAWD